MDQRDWVAVAKRRVAKVLRRRRFASNRQLEKKISEAGPGDMRPEPMKVSTAINELVRAGTLLEHPTADLGRFFSPSDFGGQMDEDRRAEIIRLATEFRELTRKPPVCGKALERVVYTAATQAGIYTVLGTPDHPPAQGFAIIVATFVLPCILSRSIDIWKIPGDIAATRVRKTTEFSEPNAESFSPSKSHSGIQTLLDKYVVTCCWAST